MNELYRTAPETIYLCVNDLDPEFCEDDSFPPDHDNVTWSVDKPVNGVVEYRKVEPKP